MRLLVEDDFKELERMSLLSKLMHESLADDVNVEPERGLLGLMRNRIVSIVRAADGHATFTARTALDPPDVTLRTHALLCLNGVRSTSSAAACSTLSSTTSEDLPQW